MNGHDGRAPGVVVTLTDSSGDVVATTRTDENGDYRFVLGEACELTGSVRRSDVTKGIWRNKSLKKTELQVEGEQGTEYDPAHGADDDDREDDGDPDEDGDLAEDDVSPAPRRSRVRVASVTAVVAVLMVGTGWVGWTNGWLGLNGTAEASSPSSSDQPATTAEVTRQTLTETREVEGTLGHGDPFALTATVPGIITAIAESDAELKRDMELYRLNERPVTALFGSVPMYRDLKTGDTGEDVKQLEANLDKLGYEGFTVNEEFSSATADAVRQWQDDLGLPETGVVARADLVFVPEGGRVDTIHTDVGGAVGQGAPVLDITSSDQIVSLEAEIEDRELLAVDTEVTVRLPDGEEVAGVVTEANVAPAASEGGEQSDGGDEASDDAVVEVEVSLDEAVERAGEVGGESLLGAPVDVVADVDQREDVLTVPVNALLALSGGGHGLEVVADDGTTSIVPVESGMFAQGRVEVTGEGIDEGMIVGVAGR